MANWINLDDAYGRAGSIPELLATAASEPDPKAEVWRDLWARLCHQGTVYTASYEALPALAAMAVHSQPGPHVPALFLAAGILAANDPGHETSLVRGRFRTEITALKGVAEQNLSYSVGFADFVYSLQNLAAFENLGVWQRHLHALADGELELECRSCGTCLYLILEAPAFVTTLDSGDPEARRTLIVPVSDERLDSTGTRLLSLARDHRQPQVLLGLLHLFGHSGCPACGATVAIADNLA